MMDFTPSDKKSEVCHVGLLCGCTSCCWSFLRGKVAAKLASLPVEVCVLVTDFLGREGNCTLEQVITSKVGWGLAAADTPARVSCHRLPDCSNWNRTCWTWLYTLRTRRLRAAASKVVVPRPTNRFSKILKNALLPKAAGHRVVRAVKDRREVRIYDLLQEAPQTIPFIHMYSKAYFQDVLVKFSGFVGTSSQYAKVASRVVLPLLRQQQHHYTNLDSLWKVVWFVVEELHLAMKAGVDLGEVALVGSVPPRFVFGFVRSDQFFRLSCLR